MTRDEVITIIYEAIERVNSLREPNQRLQCRVDTRLYGAEGNLDSLGLVSLITDVEEALGERRQTPVTLANEQALSQRSSPFRDVASLADYVLLRLRESD